MGKGVRLVSLIVMGSALFGFLAIPVQAAPPGAQDAYYETVEAVMTHGGEITGEDRLILERTKGRLGLTDEEAADIEEQVREGVRRT